MLAALRTGAVAVLLAGPAALAFRAGGYFDQPRTVAAIVAWVLVGVAALAAPAAFPRRAPGRLALGGLAALSAIVGLSILWTPLRALAQADLERLLLYLGALTAAIALLRGRVGLWVVEPALAAGALIVIGYGLAGRLLPGIVEQSVSSSAAGRLEQPLTYWNAVGALAAAGLLLALRIAADERRRRWLRDCGAAAVVPFTVAIYLSFSRGALLAAALGLVLLVALSRERAQLRAYAALGPALAACLLAGLLPGVRALSGGVGAREAQGLAMLGAIVLLMALAVLIARRARAAAADAGAPLSARRVLVAGVVVVLVAGFFGAAAGNGSSAGQPRRGADTRRLTSFESNRYSYWKVAARMFGADPLIGDGSGSFRVVWRQRRTIDDTALDAHSLYLETAGELGLAGLLALATMLLGVALACRRALAIDRQAASGAVAVVAALAAHAGLDWDWEMPALALVALLLAGALCALADEAPVS